MYVWITYTFAHTQIYMYVYFRKCMPMCCSKSLMPQKCGLISRAWGFLLGGRSSKMLRCHNAVGPSGEYWRNQLYIRKHNLFLLASMAWHPWQAVGAEEWKGLSTAPSPRFQSALRARRNTQQTRGLAAEFRVTCTCGAQLRPHLVSTHTCTLLWLYLERAAAIGFLALQQDCWLELGHGIWKSWACMACLGISRNDYYQCCKQL